MTRHAYERTFRGMGNEASAAGAALVKQRWAKTTAAERSELGRRLAEARWGKRKAAKAKRGAK